jgi:hypothetical protein
MLTIFQLSKEMEDKKMVSLPHPYHYDDMIWELGEKKGLSHIQNMGHIAAFLLVSRGNLNQIHHLHLC